jgi:hypothetical protein
LPGIDLTEVLKLKKSVRLVFENPIPDESLANPEDSELPVRVNLTKKEKEVK